MSVGVWHFFLSATYPRTAHTFVVQKCVFAFIRWFYKSGPPHAHKKKHTVVLFCFMNTCPCAQPSLHHSLTMCLTLINDQCQKWFSDFHLEPKINHYKNIRPWALQYWIYFAQWCWNIGWWDDTSPVGWQLQHRETNFIELVLNLKKWAITVTIKLSSIYFKNEYLLFCQSNKVSYDWYYSNKCWEWSHWLSGNVNHLSACHRLT